MRILEEVQWIWHFQKSESSSNLFTFIPRMSNHNPEKYDIFLKAPSEPIKEEMFNAADNQKLSLATKGAQRKAQQSYLIYFYYLQTAWHSSSFNHFKIEFTACVRWQIVISLNDSSLRFNLGTVSTHRCSKHVRFPLMPSLVTDSTLPEAEN